MTATANPKEIIYEINKVRSNPSGYAQKVDEYISYFTGPIIKIPGINVQIRTQEGDAPYKETRDFLKNEQPVGVLTPSKALCEIAQELLNKVVDSDTGEIEETETEQIIDKYGTFSGKFTRAMDFGGFTSEQVVINFLVCDGDPDRTQREPLLGRGLNKIGVAFGKHNIYSTVCVLVSCTEFTNTRDADDTPIFPDIPYSGDSESQRGMERKGEGEVGRKREMERQEAERKERERQEVERQKERERVERQKEMERREDERKERERVERQKEMERQEVERQRERERQENERKERERQEVERQKERERQEVERQKEAEKQREMQEEKRKQEEKKKEEEKRKQEEKRKNDEKKREEEKKKREEAKKKATTAKSNQGGGDPFKLPKNRFFAVTAVSKNELPEGVASMTKRDRIVIEGGKRYKKIIINKVMLDGTKQTEEIKECLD